MGSDDDTTDDEDGLVEFARREYARRRWGPGQLTLRCVAANLGVTWGEAKRLMAGARPPEARNTTAYREARAAANGEVAGGTD